MEISMIVNAVKLMAEMDYSFFLAIWNMECFPCDNTMIINYGYHEEPFPESKTSTENCCPAGYPMGYCYGCGRCEW